jgi:hypothetical protein
MFLVEESGGILNEELSLDEVAQKQKSKKTCVLVFILVKIDIEFASGNIYVKTWIEVLLVRFALRRNILLWIALH